MLNTVEASHFEPLIGQPLTLTLPDGQSLQVQVDDLALKPLARMTDEGRTPFRVGLSAPENDFLDGLCGVNLPQSAQLEGVFVSRVAPLGRDPRYAYYDIVFG